MSRHTQHELAAHDLARHDLAGRHRTAGHRRTVLAGRWEPSRDGESPSARPGLRLRWRIPATELAA